MPQCKLSLCTHATRCVALQETAHLRQQKPHLLPTHISLAVSGIVSFAAPPSGQMHFQWVYRESEEALNTRRHRPLREALQLKQALLTGEK